MSIIKLFDLPNETLTQNYNGNLNTPITFEMYLPMSYYSDVDGGRQ